MTYRWLSIAALIAKPPPPAQPCPAMTGDTFFRVLFVLVFLLLLGVIGGGIWMFRTGRWQAASHQNIPFPAGNLPPPAYRPRTVTNTPPTGRNVSFPVSTPPAYPPSNRNIVPPVTPSPVSAPRDNVLRDTRWLGLAQDCAYLFDELDENMASSDAPRREIARHIETRLREILVHSNVEAIDRDRTFNESRHQLERPDATAAPGTPIVAFVSPGFAVERRVLRRAIVRVASEYEE